jgi:plasmid maintenance system antidote protein VapI
MKLRDQLPRFETKIRTCIICGAEFRRSGLIEDPPKLCGRECLKKWRAGQKHEKYVIAEHWFEPIRKMYANGVNHGEVTRMAKRIGVPRTKITNIARSKGWLPKKNSPDYHYHWCDKELEIVGQNGHLSPITVQRYLKSQGFNRTVSAVEVKRAQLNACQNRKGMTADDLAQCMGVDVHNILSAIKREKLKARRRPGYTGKNAAYMIMDKDIKAYIMTWLPEINLAYCDKFWLVDILAR